MIRRLILFGATGDLAGRFLLPALADLSDRGALPPDLEIVAAAVEDWTDERYRRHAEERLRENAEAVSARARTSLVRGIRYARVDFSDRDGLAALVSGAPLAAYLALPPAVFPVAVQALDDARLPEGSRVAVEKPFGEDLESARALNARLARLAGEAGEHALFRVDHVLGFHTLQNLLGLRFANRVPGAIWNAEHVAEVEILWEETLGLEGRAGFYDRTGALKDVMQNHMMQILAVVAMDPPEDGTQAALRHQKVEALRAVRSPQRDEMGNRTRRARYVAGRLYEDDGAIRGEAKAYADEVGVDASRGTETFAEVELAVENARWKGTRFVLRAGKALRRRRKGVRLKFRPLGQSGAADGQNGLWVGIDGPRDISLHCVGSTADTEPRPELVVLSGSPPSAELPAYGRVLLDLLRGGGALSVGADEAEEAWRIVTPVIEAWAQGVVPLEEYPAGADALVASRPNGKEAAWGPR